MEDSLWAEKIIRKRTTKSYNQRSVEFLGDYKVEHSEKKYLERRKMLRDEVAELGKNWIIKDLECHH